jgi:hypothetical protein
MLYIDGKRRALLVVGGALVFGLWFGFGSGVLACGILGALVGGGLGAIIE